MKEIRKTSVEWEKESDYQILDPDGWDRKGDFNYSFNVELITEEEFWQRLVRSTVLYTKGEIDKEKHTWAK